MVFFPCAEISSTKRVIIIAVLSLLYRSLKTPDTSAERSLQKHLLLIHSDEEFHRESWLIVLLSEAASA